MAVKPQQRGARKHQPDQRQELIVGGHLVDHPQRRAADAGGDAVAADDAGGEALPEDAYTEEELDDLVAPIALYPDSLLAPIRHSK